MTRGSVRGTSKALFIGGFVVVAALASTRGAAQTLRRPVACDTCIVNWFYFDATGSAAGVQDWNCRTSTYDGHRGSDFSLAGGTAAIADGYAVVAAADGTVVSTVDGNYDRCTTCDASVDGRCGTDFGFGYGNHVVINHGSRRVVYAHLRQGSVRVAPGDAVTCGDVIGEIGSSGCSTGAHLHFETRPLGTTSSSAFDPFEGGCSTTSPSLFTSQGPHRGLPAPTCDPTVTCPAGTFPLWTCDAEGTSRRRCVDGSDELEPCPWGCLSTPADANDLCERAPDADGDGATADVDCDDTDPERHPGAMDRCGDGLDQDCDGLDAPCAGSDGGTDAGRNVPGDGGRARGRGSLRGSCTCRAAGHGPSPAGLWLAMLLVGAGRIFRR